MIHYAIEPRIKNMPKDMEFCYSQEHYPANMEKKLLDTSKTGLDAPKFASKKVFYKITKATGELIGNKITKTILKPKTVSNVNSRNDGNVVILPEKRQKY